MVALPVTASAATIQPFADVLAWRASETSSYWAETITPAIGTAYNVDHSSIDFNTRTGFRVGFNYIPDNNFLDTTLFWTSFSSGSSATIPLANHAITSLFFSGSAFFTDAVFDTASANWQLAMNMVDLQISHHFNPLPSLKLTPKIGLKGGTINQTINVNWNALIFSLDLYSATEKATNNYTGFGPTFGLNAEWNALQNLSFVGDITAALMYGRWNNSDMYHRPPVILGLIPEQTIYTSMNHNNLGSLMMDYYLGLKWVHQGKSRIAFDLGYEMQYWSGQARWLSVKQFPPLGDLTLQGATCGITIDL